MSTPQNCQSQLNNSLAKAVELFECVWLFVGLTFKELKSTPSIIAFSSVNSLVLNHNFVIPSKPANLYNLFSCGGGLEHDSTTTKLAFLSPPLVFEWWINELSFFRLTKEIENNDRVEYSCTTIYLWQV